jgi:hypothetical protein
MKLFLQIFALSDRYERKARLLPGLLVAAGPALTGGALIQELAAWYTAWGTAIGVEFLAAVVLGHYARSRGRAVEESLWESWGGAPTIRWLRPDDQSCSSQQKSLWREAIKRHTGISLPATVPENATEKGVDQEIAEATRQLRYVLRGKPNAEILQSHNEDYGFARNLYGVRFLWVALAAICVAVCAISFAFGMRPFAAIAIALVVLAVSVLVAWELPVYVRRCADRYAESLFAVAMLPDPPPKSKTKKIKSKSAETDN